MKILVVNGPNLDLLGRREPDVYGTETLDDIIRELRRNAELLDVEIDFFHSNEEGELITKVGQAGSEYDGIIINPAGYTHTSVALRDALAACGLPCVETHLSNVHAREDFRQKNLTAGACLAQVQGFGARSYTLALQGLAAYLGGSCGK